MKPVLVAALAAAAVGYTVQPIGSFLLPLVRPALAVADYRPPVVLVGNGCAGASGPLYALYEDDLPPCRAIQRVNLAKVPACELARLLPTDSNIEACTGRPIELRSAHAPL